MTDDIESYERQCFARARYYLQDNEIEKAISYLLFERDMSSAEIKAAADLLCGWESGDMDLDE